MDIVTFNDLTNNKKSWDKMDTMQSIEFQLTLLFLQICNHRFKYEGLPDELRNWELETILNQYGQAVLFKYQGLLIACQPANTGNLDLYSHATKVQPIGLNGYAFPDVYVGLTIDDKGNVVKPNAVLIRNNDFSIPTYTLIQPIVERLCFIWQSLGINESLTRFKALIHANKDISGAVKVEIKKLFGSSSPFPVVSEKMNVLKSIEKLDLDVEYTPELYWEDFDRTFNLACQLLGITSNVNNDKKERMIVAEVESNDECTTIIEDMSLEHRKEGIELVNKLFSYNISVDNKVGGIKATNPVDNQGEEFNPAPNK